jgi:hypothetical protein
MSRLRWVWVNLPNILEADCRERLLGEAIPGKRREECSVGVYVEAFAVAASRAFMN